jgi:hypothetical protein
MKSNRNPMKKTLALSFLPHALPGFALTPVLAQTSTPEQTMAAAHADYASPRTGDSAVVETLTLAPSFFYE